MRYASVVGETNKYEDIIEGEGDSALNRRIGWSLTDDRSSVVEGSESEKKG